MSLEDPRVLVERFVDSRTARTTLALVYGRRRIGKSTLLDSVAVERGGFRWEATRSESAVQLARLGSALGEHLGVGPLALASWHDATSRLLQVGSAGQPLPIVLDEFGYVLEADPSVDSVIASLLGPGGDGRQGRARLILCGSAIAMMKALTAGQAPLRGRAGMELVMQPYDFRTAATVLGDPADLDLAVRVYSVIGGVIGYATDMVDHDLPADFRDFDRWVAERVLSPAATLHHEATTLLAEDPTLSGTNPTLYHSVLGAIANGSVTAGRIANRLRRAVSNLDSPLKRLIDAGFVVRHVDPIRSQRPTYALLDPLLQFHYAVLEPHGSFVRDRDPAEAWTSRLQAIFDARVRGPVLEELARTWVRRHATSVTLGGEADRVGPSTVTYAGKTRQLDVVVASDDNAERPPSERTVLAIGEAKSGETLGPDHVHRLELARAALGPRAAHAKLLLFGPAAEPGLIDATQNRSDVEIIDLQRLYHGD